LRIIPYAAIGRRFSKFPVSNSLKLDLAIIVDQAHQFKLEAIRTGVNTHGTPAVSNALGVPKQETKGCLGDCSEAT
jgi:hypothetical protein